jgi:hypothetical protein
LKRHDEITNFDKIIARQIIKGLNKKPFNANDSNILCGENAMKSDMNKDEYNIKKLET